MPSGAKKRKAARRKKEHPEQHPQGGFEGESEVKALSLEPSTPDKKESPSSKTLEGMEERTIVEDNLISGSDSACVGSENAVEKNTHFDNSSGVVNNEETPEMGEHWQEKIQLDSASAEPQMNSTCLSVVLRNEDGIGMKAHVQEENTVNGGTQLILNEMKALCEEENSVKEDSQLCSLASESQMNSKLSTLLLTNQDDYEVKMILQEENMVNENYSQMDGLLPTITVAPHKEDDSEMRVYLQEENTASEGSQFDSLRLEQQMNFKCSASVVLSKEDDSERRAHLQEENTVNENTRLDSPHSELQMNSKCSATVVLSNEDDCETGAHLQVHHPASLKEKTSWMSCCGIFDLVVGGK